MFKRIGLFLITNLAIVLTVSIVLNLLGVGQYVGPNGLDLRSLAIFCFVWGMAGAFISLQISRWSAKRMTGMTLVNGRTGNSEADWLYQTVERLTRQARLPMPEVGIYNSPEMNAFATGPSKSRSLVAVSSGLLRSMRPNEVEGVLAHEVAHIANGDMVTMALLQGVVNAFVMFIARVVAYFLTNRRSDDSRGSSAPNFMLVWMLEIVLGVIGMMVVAWFSRQREFRADHGGASLAGKADMLAALRRLGGNRELDHHNESLATLKISGKWTGLFSTHPPLGQRIAVLERAQIAP